MIPRSADYQYMKKALKEAQKAFIYNEVPIGAVLVDQQGKIIGRGYNAVERRQQQIAHAEVIAISKGCHYLKNWRLNGCWLYVTLEPCTMCMGLMRLSRLEGVVYGADSLLFGYSLDKRDGVQLYKENVLNVIKGVCAQESIELLQQFFKQKRVKP